MKSIHLLIIASVLCGSLTYGQEEESSSSGLNLTIGHTGLSFGNSSRINGIRINWSDSGLDEINGINFTLWKPSEKDPGGDINGLALGLVAPAAGNLRGISLTPGAVLAGTSMNGIQIGGLALVSQGSINGISLAGLASVAQGNISWLAIGGLATVAQGDIDGFAFGGLATVAQGSVQGFSIGTLASVTQGSLWGFSIGGLASVTQGSLTGISMGGLATVVQGDLTGCSFGGLAVVSQGSISGINLGGLAIVGPQSVSGINLTLGQIKSDAGVNGLNIAGYKIEGRRVQGLNLGVGWTESENIGYFTVAAYNRTYDTQTGVTIGVFNHTHNLAGIQIGLLNYVESNPSPFKYLPLINVNL